MSPLEALALIAQEAADYASNRDRFRPHANTALDALRDLHIYREGVRDGKLQAARIALQAIEQNELKMFVENRDSGDNSCAIREGVISTSPDLTSSVQRRDDAR